LTAACGGLKLFDILPSARTRQRLEEVSMNIGGGPPDIFAAHMKSEPERWTGMFNANNIKVE
jgi:hypothetical protein